MLNAIQCHQRLGWSGFRRRTSVLGFAAAALLGALLLAPPAVASPPARLTFRMVTVASPGNPSVSIVPFTDAIYPSCSVAPRGPTGCLNVGSVGYRYEVGELEVTVAQWIAFLNTVDPAGTDPHRLYDASYESATS